MVGNKNNTTSGFSWADEVEKEEQEEAQVQIYQQQKPNPFGSARPREVVLQEKGVDWKKLDRKLHETSNFCYVPKKEKENIPAQTELINGKHIFPPSSRGNINQKIENSRKSCNRSKGQLVSQTIQNQQDLLVPPLMYPPKNAMILMNDIQWSHNNSYKTEAIPPNFHNPRIENSILESGRQTFTVNESMHHQLRREAPNLRIMRPPLAQREREMQNKNSNYKRRNFSEEKFMGPPPPPLPSTINKHEHGNFEFEYRRRRVDSGEFVFPSVDSVGRTKGTRNVETEREVFRGNCKKRGMKSGFNNTQGQHHRMRR